MNSLSHLSAWPSEITEEEKRTAVLIPPSLAPTPRSHTWILRASFPVMHGILRGKMFSRGRNATALRIFNSYMERGVIGGVFVFVFKNRIFTGLNSLPDVQWMKNRT